MNTTPSKPDSVSIVNITPARATVAADHALHARRQRDVGMREALVDAVGDRPVVVERREDVMDAVEDRIDAGDVQKGLLLACERGVGQVFGGRAGPDRECHFT